MIESKIFLIKRLWIILDTKCARCRYLDETADHIFWECQIAKIYEKRFSHGEALTIDLTTTYKTHSRLVETSSKISY